MPRHSPGSRPVPGLLRPLGSLLLAACLGVAGGAAAADVPTREATLATMKRATRFMVEEVATEGGYVWSYLPDRSRQWGELEAYPSMIWVQPPGTATMGHLFLDAYHATGDAYYYDAARQAADALVAGQHDSGGWNYLIDTAGEDSLRKWYDTIGRNAWRLEEFQHDYGNATFDDGGTSEAMQFLLRLYLEKRDAAYRAPLEKAIDFVLDSQYPIGGWPQRYPHGEPVGLHGLPDYTPLITFNDDVAEENIEFLLMVHRTLDYERERVLDAIGRAMNAFLVTQQGQPQPGWGLQYTTPDLKPAGARSYEPNGIVTHATAANVRKLMDFYRLTGDSKFLARIPEALDWLDRVRLPEALVVDGRTHPTFLEIGTDRPIYLHRRGSNVSNGAYYTDHDPANTIGHYGSTRRIDVAALRAEYEALANTPPEQASEGSPLLNGGSALPRYFTLRDVSVSDLNVGVLRGRNDDVAPEAAAALIDSLDAQGWWPTELRSTSHPYIGDGPRTPPPGDYAQTLVGDASDTSPYRAETPVMGISTGAYIEHMGTLIRYLEP
ncbi:pectate lyase [Luteimonas salinilitoris]|uniref:Pectate lyase n=1 Tax=Luteimonas salinilitoris TaxID=3237697 RepID=A0ABV4HUW0_9GAMM